MARPGRVPILVRASSNEAPGPAPEELVEAAAAAVRDAARYPSIGAVELVDALAVVTELSPSQVVVGDGALSLLDRILLAFVEPGAQVVMGWRSYEAYPLSVQIAGGRSVRVPLDGNGRHDLAAMTAAITADTRMVIVCNPNNPTGTAVPWQRLAAFLDGVPSGVLVVLDQAYIEYADGAGMQSPPAAQLIDRPNVVVLRTFSKAHAMAGLRVGYAMADPVIVAAIRSVSPPFPVSTPAVAAALSSLAHPQWLTARVKNARAERLRVSGLLADHGMRPLPSEANFLWVPLGDRSASFARACADHGVLVRPFDGEGVRITVGDPRLADALAPVLAQW